MPIQLVRCAVCNKEIAADDAHLVNPQGGFSYCSDRCAQAYKLVGCPWCFAERYFECVGRQAHHSRTMKAAEYVQKFLTTPIEELIERSSLGTDHATRLRKKAEPKTVDQVLLRVDELEKKE